MKNIIFIFLLFVQTSFSQNILIGKVIDKDKQQPVFAANIYWKSAMQQGTTSDFDGIFAIKTLQITEKSDTLVVSFIGYETKEIALKSIKDTLIVQLASNIGVLQEVSIVAQDPISQDFSVVKLDKMQIYTNPLAAGDALKAITILPSSTNTDETANPALRGSSADRTRILFNGVPIYNPVRNSQLNGLGNFSLFNTEMIHKMYVYASNPPLTFGNTSAGLVEIETIKNLKTNQLQVSLGLANTGIFWSKKVGKKNFLQFYTNYQFPTAFIGLNKSSIPRLNDFGTTDGGLNLNIQIGRQWVWNSFSYLIDEHFGYRTNVYTYDNNSKGGKQRGFFVNNISKQFAKSILKINNLVDFSKQNYEFGSLVSNSKQQQIYTSIDYKYLGLRKFTLQVGGNYDYANYVADSKAPIFFYALAPETQTYTVKQNLENHNIEFYAYMTYAAHEKVNISTASRVNVPTNAQVFYASSQISATYQPTNEQRWLLSAGKYHNYSTPNVFNPAFNLLDSWQAALDYEFKKTNFELLAAIYYKQDGGIQNLANQQLTFRNANKFNTFGAEIAIKKDFGKRFSVTVSNTFVSQQMKIGSESFKSADDLPYFVKAVATYNHPKIVTIALSYLTREGKYFTPIIGGNYNPRANFYEPVWSNQVNSQQYGNYHNLSLNLNRYFKVGKTGLIVFASVNNLLNISNERDFFYSSDYKTWEINPYQLRTFYGGMVWQLSY
jgi:hypothetical protein